MNIELNALYGYVDGAGNPRVCWVRHLTDALVGIVDVKINGRHSAGACPIEISDSCIDADLTFPPKQWLEPRIQGLLGRAERGPDVPATWYRAAAPGPWRITIVAPLQQATP